MRIKLITLIAISLLASSIFVSAMTLGSDPLPLFTSNLYVSNPTQEITAMEKALLDRINSATVSIDLTIYDFNRSTVKDALVAAQERGVVVRVVTDDVSLMDPDYAPFFTLLEAVGITVVDDARSSTMHNKFIVIDGSIVWTGSTNLTDNDFTFNHNNSVVFTSTLLADIYTTEFNEMFMDRRFGTQKHDNTPHLLDYDGIPLEIYFSPSDGALDEIISEVASAEESIYFSIYFFTIDSLSDAFIERQQAGVTIAGVWDRLGAGNHASKDETLCSAGIPIKIEDFSGKMHNKFMVIDAHGALPRVATGSMNWSNSGDKSNDENTLIIHDSQVAQMYLTAFEQLYQALGPETLCLENSRRYLPTVLKDGKP